MDQVALRILEGDAKAVVLFKELPMTDQVGACVYVCVCVCVCVSCAIRLIRLVRLVSDQLTQ